MYTDTITQFLSSVDSNVKLKFMSTDTMNPVFIFTRYQLDINLSIYLN